MADFLIIVSSFVANVSPAEKPCSQHSNDSLGLRLCPGSVCLCMWCLSLKHRNHSGYVDVGMAAHSIPSRLAIDHSLSLYGCRLKCASLCTQWRSGGRGELHGGTAGCGDWSCSFRRGLTPATSRLVAGMLSWPCCAPITTNFSYGGGGGCTGEIYSPNLSSYFCMTLSQRRRCRNALLARRDCPDISRFARLRFLSRIEPLPAFTPHSAGIEGDVSLPEDVKKTVRLRAAGRGFIVASDLRREQEPLADAEGGEGSIFKGYEELYYYVPCVVRDRMVAIIGIGRTTTGAMLTSEDTELLGRLACRR